MKSFAFVFALVACIAIPVLADDKLANIPKEKEGRWGVYTFEDAKAEAAKKKQPIVVMVVDHRTEETSVEEANKRTFWGMQKDATMVVVMSNLLTSGKVRLGDVVYGALSAADLGKGMPKLVVTTPEANVILGKMGSEQLMTADEKTMKDFAKQMDAANKNPPKPGTEPAAMSPAPGAAAAPGAAVAIKNPTAQGWTNVDGRTIQAALIEVGAEEVVFQMADGSRVNYPLKNLNEASQQKVQELKAASAQ